MNRSRHISLALHAGIETLAGPLVMAAPFVLGFERAATVISVIVGVLLIGLAIQIPGPHRSISLSSHASFDYALATFAFVSGIALGFTTGVSESAAFLVGIGVVQMLLTAGTRFSTIPIAQYR